MNNPPLDQAPAGARLTIDLGAIADNWRQLDAMAGAAECAAVVKADAYGLGIEQVVPTLWKAGCRTFFVALPGEGIRVRKAAPEAIIYILAGYFADALDIYRHYALRPVINMEFDAWVKAGRNDRLAYAVQLETGMNRLGMPISDYDKLQASGLLDDYQPSLLISHLACADTPGHALNALQQQRFSSAVENHPCNCTSLANSAGIFLGSDYHYDLVRPGIALYGGACTSALGADNPMRPVISLAARILQLKAVAPGETIGYGGAETVRPSPHSGSNERFVATIAAGYADGYLRSAGSSDQRRGGCAAWRGTRIPIIGRVSMDLISVDLTDHPDVAQLQDGRWYDEWIELIGPAVPLDDVAGAAGTISYELLTGLGNRYQRTYINGL
uniref:alanine racemase n=1 Tax=Pararhizobium sp. IMCC3301 TaxID=3067904 RepID=UPI002740AB56|nr:alanine racemase [Pararhizobium sp. IMCC3301]